MHGCSLASGLPVNAEAESMGGVVEVGDSAETGVLHAAIEKVQAELRQEYDVREERRRELEYLEKGGNPLDFNVRKAASTSVQSISLTGQHPKLLKTSEAKDRFAFIVSTHVDSVESSGRPGVQSACEPISADNLILFDGENYSVEGDRIAGCHNRINVDLKTQSYNPDGSQIAKDIGESGAVAARKLYNRRRYRSRSSRDAAKSSSSDAVPARVINGSSLHSYGGSRNFKGLVSDREQEQKASSNGDSTLTCPVSVVCGTAPYTAQMDAALDIVNAVKSTIDPIKGEKGDSGKDSDITKGLDSDPQKLGVHKDHALIAPEEVVVDGLGCQASLPLSVVETHVNCGQMKGSCTENLDVKSTNSVRTDNATIDSNLLESVSPCTQTKHSLDKNVENGMCTNGRHVDTSGDIEELASTLRGNESIQLDHETKEEDKIEANEIDERVEHGSLSESLKENGFMLKAAEESNAELSDMHNDVENQDLNKLNNEDVVEMDVDGCGVSETGRDYDVPSGDMKPRDEDVCKVMPDGSSSLPIVSQPTEPPVEVSTCVPAVQASSASALKATRDEDSILEQAQIIEAKRKRIAQLSFSDTPGDCCPKSHWGLVLEEMAWMANDFAQERLWKISAASQVGRRVSLLSLSRIQKQNCCLEGQKVAQSLARAVMEFWHSLEGKSQEQELQCHHREISPALQEYALRFQRSNTSEDQHFEENPVYVVLPGAMAKYRNSVESCVVKYEKTGSSLPEEFETSTSDAVADNAYEGDDGDTSLYDLSVALDSSKSLKYPHKKLKISTKAYSGRKLEAVAGSPFFLDKKVGNEPPVFMGKRPDNSFNESFPTKRVRTTSNRQRVLGSFAAGTSCALGPTKTDASSGDTNSFQDDQSTLDGVPRAVNNLEFESVGDVDKRLGYDSAEVSPQPKKKKARFSGSAYEQRWLVESNFLNSQRDHSRKRLKSHQFESNGGSGLLGHNNAKKPKMVRQSINNAIESSTQFGGSAASPVASQFSIPNKLRKYFGGRDGGRKNKMLKIPASQSGSESPWSLLEEQALAVLVHDLGPNWELVCDAVNSTLQFQSIFRSPKECKEHHKQLMDMTSGDWADSAEDSGSSQPYSSTLPGIPQGSARQLFQQLQGRMEEDTLKYHVEKIIMIGQKLHCRRKQEPKQLQQPHGSHMAALAQVYPQNSGLALTPLDFCDATACSSDVLPLGYLDAHSTVLPTSNQGMPAMLNASGANSPVLGSSNMTSGNNFSSSPAPVTASPRDGRYALPKSTNMTIEEQRIQQYNQMLSGRNVSQTNLSSPGSSLANDRTLPKLHGSNGVPIASGGNRSLPIARPGFQGIASSSMSNVGSTATSGMVTMPSPVGCGQGNSLRPRDTSHMNPPTQNQDAQRQMMMPELQMQTPQGSNMGTPPFAAMSSAFPNQRASSSYGLNHQQSHSLRPQQLHPNAPRHPHIKGNVRLPNPQHQAYAIRLAKERQLQQRILQRQQQQQQQQQPPFQSHNPVMPHVQSQAQLPILSPPHNSSQATPPIATPPAMFSPLTQNSHMTSIPQHRQQHPSVPTGHEPNAQSPNSMTNQGKQRQRQLQQFAQSARQHPQQRQQVKISKGLGRGSMAVRKKIATEPSNLHALSVDSGNHSGENGEQPMHLLHGKGLYPSSATNHVSTGKSLARQSSNESQPVQMMCEAGQVSAISKPLHQKPSNPDGINQGRVSQVSPGTSSMDEQSVSRLVMAPSGQQQKLQPQGRTKLVKQRQPSGQKVLRQNLHLNSESTNLQGSSEPQNEQILMVSSQTVTSAIMSPASNDASNVSKVISPANDTRGGSELLYDSVTSSPALHTGSSGSASTCTDTLHQVDQGPGEQHLSDNFPSVSHDVSAQQQQQTQVHLPPSPDVFQDLQQQDQSLQQQSHPLLVSQPPTQLKGSMYVRPPESLLE